MGTNFTKIIKPVRANGEANIQIIINYFTNFIITNPTKKPFKKTVISSWGKATAILKYPKNIFKQRIIFPKEKSKRLFQIP